jgi:hypothetical protein
MKTDFQFSAWQGMVELVVATWLIMSPFLLGFFDHAAAGLVSISIGVLIIFMTLLGISRQPIWEDGFSLLLAFLLLTSPWLFGYSTHTLATWNAVVTGIFTAGFTLAVLIRDYDEWQEARRPIHHRHS